MPFLFITAVINSILYILCSNDKKRERALTVWQVRGWHVRHFMFILLSYELNFHTHTAQNAGKLDIAVLKRADDAVLVGRHRLYQLAPVTRKVTKLVLLARGIKLGLSNPSISNWHIHSLSFLSVL